jgi:hypothetical protein
LFHLDIAVKQESRVILVVILHCAQGLERTGRCLGWGLDQLLEILYQVRKLLDFNVSLDNVAGIEVANSFDVLLQCLVKVSLLIIKLISMLFADLGLNLFWELSSNRDVLSFLEHALL